MQLLTYHGQMNELFWKRFAIMIIMKWTLNIVLLNDMIGNQPRVHHANKKLDV